MDLKAFYQKIREVEASIEGEYPVVVSLATPDGGKEGTLTETPRGLAARMVVKGQARLASEEEAMEFRDLRAQAKRLAEQAAAASRLQLTVLTTADLNKLKGSGKSAKD